MSRELRKAKIEEIHEELSRRRRLELTKDVILAIATATAFSAGIILAPKLTSFLCNMLYRRTKNRYYLNQKSKVRQVLHRLRQQSIINWYEDKGGTVKITLTEHGQKRILRYKLDEMAIKQPAQWDGRWRVTIFDIPEEHKLARDVLRDKFKTLGLYQLQKSVWIFPYVCKNEIDFISNVYGVGKYLLYFETKNLENERFLRHKFQLSV